MPRIAYYSESLSEMLYPSTVPTPEFKLLGPVVQSTISANPGLNFNLLLKVNVFLHIYLFRYFREENSHWSRQDL
jgi:hypothetical protein